MEKKIFRPAKFQHVVHPKFYNHGSDAVKLLRHLEVPGAIEGGGHGFCRPGVINSKSPVGEIESAKREGPKPDGGNKLGANFPS